MRVRAVWIRESVELQEPLDRSPGPEGIYLKQQAILLVRREVEKLPPSLRSVVNHYYGSECSLEEAAKAQRDLFGRSKVSSSARASQAAFFACEIWNLQVPQLSSTVGPTHHLNR